MSVAAPARYFPMANGLYEVAPGLRPFGTDFGNGVADSRVFQIDTDFARYRSNKVKARNEKLNKYYLNRDFSFSLNEAVCAFIVERLLAEYPEHFSREGDEVLCALSGERVRADDFDALCMQVQEDLAVMQVADESGSPAPAGSPKSRDYLRAIHLCAPNHWAAADKIGRSFVEIHQPVAGIDKVNRAAPGLLQAMTSKGPYVRFAWGVSTDTRLNHHPQPPPGHAAGDWQGRAFDPDEPRLYLRIERQTLWPFEALSASLFTIRTYFRDCAELELGEKQALSAALRSMSPESRVYKGLSSSMDAVLAWLTRSV